MKIKIKKLNKNATIPSYAKPGDAGLDLTAVRVSITDKFIEYGTGLAIEIPKGFVGIIRPRSSVSNYDLIFSTSGVIDSGYRGELKVRYKITHNNDGNTTTFNIGERVAQLLILSLPEIELIESEELSETERGDDGHGSSGK